MTEPVKINSTGFGQKYIRPILFRRDGVYQKGQCVGGELQKGKEEATWGNWR